MACSRAMCEGIAPINLTTGKVVWVVVEGNDGGAFRGVVIQSDARLADGYDGADIVTLTLKVPIP